jgi:hypothetical protein
MGFHLELGFASLGILQAVGHSYNLFDIHSKRLLNVEVGPGGASSVLEVNHGSFYFHANMFKHLVVQQRVDNSSYHREVRALHLQVGAYRCL